MAKPKPLAPPRFVEQYERVLERAGLERKGAKNPYTSMNGHMTSYLGPDGVMALRLSKDDRARFMKKYGVEQPVAYGVVMKEYVNVPANMLARPASALAWIEKMVAYVGSLDPKATSKKKKTSKKKPAKKKPAKRKPTKKKTSKKRR